VSVGSVLARGAAFGEEAPVAGSDPHTPTNEVQSSQGPLQNHGPRDCFIRSIRRDVRTACSEPRRFVQFGQLDQHKRSRFWLRRSFTRRRYPARQGAL